DAVKWYTLAAEHFRRAPWRLKSEEALTRLGAPIPPQVVPSTAAGEAFAAGPNVPAGDADASDASNGDTLNLRDTLVTAADADLTGHSAGAKSADAMAA